MKKIYFTLFIIALASLSPILPAEIFNIERWAGKYPDDEIDGSTIWKLKPVDQLLKKILGKNKYQELKKIKYRGPQTPVESTNKLLSFTVCQKHNCGHKFYFFYKRTAAQLFVCEHQEEPSLRVIWYGEKGLVEVPNGECEFYDEKNKEIDWEKTLSLIPPELQ